MREIHLLLGDFAQEHPSVQAWVQALQEHIERQIQHATTIPYESDPRFEYSCALLYDSRLSRAQENFQIIYQIGVGKPLEILARIGHGYALSLRSNYKSADYLFRSAIDRATRSENQLLLFLARTFLILNHSDWGFKADPETLPPRFTDVTPLPEPPLLNLLESFSTYVRSRLLFRHGLRREALNLLEDLISRTSAKSICPIVRGMLVRMRGIVLSTLNRTSEARADIEQAIEIFESVGFKLGEVRALLSLARTHAATDHLQTRRWLARARAILDDTAPPPTRSPDRRYMPGELAGFYSRQGELEFFQGNIDEALHYYRDDHRTLLDMTTSLEDELPRPAAYAHRNIGRALNAQRNYEEGAEELLKSADLFGIAGDEMNRFFSLLSRCEALLALNSFPAARAQIEELSQILSARAHRIKERAALDILRSSLIWRQDRDYAAIPLLASAQSTLRQTPDYFFIRSLLIEAEILDGQGDALEARHRVAQARRTAANLEHRYLESETSNILARMGVPEVERDRLVKSDLEWEAERRGLVKKTLSILFADLRNFTKIAHQIDLDVMGEFISRFAGLVSRQVGLSEGLPVRFLGDCVMAIFGIRGSIEERELLGAQAAYRIHQRFRSLRDEWGQKAPQINETGLGFGLATGDVVAGQFGSSELVEFSVIGTAVNKASRLQGEARDGQLIICEETHRILMVRAPSIEVREEVFDLKGLGSTRAYVTDLTVASRHLQGGVGFRSVMPGAR